MKIRLMRLHNGENLGKEFSCALCGGWWSIESVVGLLDPPVDLDEGVCPSCIEYFGKRNPERFATIEEYRDAIERFPEPVWANSEEISRAEKEGAAAYEETFDASWIGRHRLAWASS